MTNKETAVARLKEKTTAAQRHFRALKKNTYFAQIPELDLKALAYRATSAKVCEILACHRDEEVRIGVAMNPQTSYNTLLFLLTDKDKEVSRRVMSWGKLKPADFVALAESFAEGIDPDGWPTLIPTGYFQITKINLRFKRCWIDSQSYRILHNPHIGQNGLRSIYINGFQPFKEDHYQELEAYKREKIEWLKSGQKPFDYRLSKDPEDYLPTWELPMGWFAQLEDRRFLSSHLSDNDAHELEQLLMGSAIGLYREAQLSAAIQVSGWDPHPLMARSLKSDRKIAQSESLKESHIAWLLDSYDARTVRYVLANPSTKGSTLWAHFERCPSYILDLPNFRTWMAEQTMPVKGYEHHIAFILKRISHCRDTFARGLLENFEIDLTLRFPTDIFEEVPEWIEYISLLISHPSTHPDTLFSLRNLLEQHPQKNSLHSDNFKNAISKRLQALCFIDSVGESLLVDFIVYLQERGSELYESNIRPSEFRNYM